MTKLKRWIVALLPFLSASCGEGGKTSGELRTIDPKKILFSLPTLSDPAPAVDASPAPDGSRMLHEDDWRQIEFVPVSDHDYVRHELAALDAFKTEHRMGMGWDSMYLRKEYPEPLAALDLKYTVLPTFPFSPLSLSGRSVHGGFALSDSAGWFLYGQRSSEGGIINLAVSPGRSACSAEFASGLVGITQVANVMLVDWYAGLIVDTKSPESVLMWARRYQPQ